MGDHGAIADAGFTLVELLRNRMSDLVSDDQVVLASPVDEDLKNSVRLTVYLFDVDRAGHLKNARHPEPESSSQTDDALRLALKYLLTIHPGQGTSDMTTSKETQTEHKVLGRAMQVLQDNAIVRGPDLRGSLAAADEKVHVSMLPKTTETVTNIWNTFDQKPYQPSVAYLVTPIRIASQHDQPVEPVEHIEFEEYTRVGVDDE